MGKKAYLLCSLVILCLIQSCKKSHNSGNDDIGVARLTSFALKSNTFPTLQSCRFVIETYENTGLIYPVDSLPFGIRLDTVFPVMSFSTTPSSVLFRYATPDIQNKNEKFYTLADTFFWGKAELFPISMMVISWDKANYISYALSSIPIKKVNPDLFVWKRLTDEICPLGQGEQKVLQFKDALLFYAGDGIKTDGYISDDAVSWRNFSISGLPGNAFVRNFICTSDTIYYCDGEILYTSSDGSEWQKDTLKGEEYLLMTPLFYWIDTLWYVAENRQTSKLELVSLVNKTVKPSGIVLGDNFPISNFATVSFNSVSGRLRSLIYGGLDEVGEPVSGGWNFEYSSYHGIRMQRIGNTENGFSQLLDASLLSYNDTLYMFGGIMADAKYNDTIYFSVDEGVNWFAADTSTLRLPILVGARCKQTALLWKGDICLIGGQTKYKCYSDVYIGWLNKKKYNWN